jgi:glucose-1-phosphate cytidylyltransferase
MKAVILAGGLGTRISEETDTKPKPMVAIGGYPVLWHIMKIYSSFGINDFIICCGYKGYVIKEYFANYSLHRSDVTIDLQNHDIRVLQNYAEPWKVTLVDTGLETMTGGRLRRVREYLDDESFCFTYGDGVSDVDIASVIKFHESQDRLATVVAVRPPGRFGAIDMDENLVTAFREKPAGDGNFINGGFFVLEPGALDYVDGDRTVWEREPLEKLASEKQLSAFIHDGFWQCMDTLRDKIHLEALWCEDKAPWKRW